MDPSAGAKPRRRTQAERRTATRSALLEATIECLVEYGYAHTTTTRVVATAGVSRGAQVHHFPTKAELVTEAVSYLADLRAEEIRVALEELPDGRERRLAALDMLWNVHTGPLFAASLELWVAARTDDELREQLTPIERSITQRLLESGPMLFGVEGDSEFPAKLTTVISAVRGLAMGAILLRAPSRGTEVQWHVLRAELAAILEG